MPSQDDIQILDEYLFTCFADENSLDITCFIKDTREQDALQSVLRFNLVPFIDKYIHLIGFAKQNVYACEQLEMRYEFEFGDSYRKTIEIINDLNPQIVDRPALLALRKNRLMKSLRTMYTSSYDELLDLKIQVCKELPLESPGSATLNNSRRSSTTFSGCDEILLHFQSPVSINEILEDIIEEGDDLENIKFRLIDILSEKILIDGILEFV